MQFSDVIYKHTILHENSLKNLNNKAGHANKAVILDYK